jgi:biopolymer transport protein TolR
MGAGVSGSEMTGGGRRHRKPMSDINVTPLVDVMLVLLIIFMVTVPSLKDAIEIDLPKHKGTSSQFIPTDLRPELKMRVDKFGQLKYDGRIFSDSEVKTGLPGLLKGHENCQVILNMNRQTPLQPVVRVMSVIRKAGIKTIRMNPDDSPE